VTNQIKQRVIGICVLVFLALILLPWLFDTNQHVVVEEKNKKEILASADVPEMMQISKNMSKPIPDEVGNQEPSQVNEPKTLKQASATDTIQTHGFQKFTLNDFNSEKMDAIQNDIVHTSPTKEEKINVKERKVEVKPAPLPKIKPSGPGKKSHTQFVSKKWTIQLGSFSNKENAQKLLKQLKAKGYCAYSKVGKNAEDELITRVYVGPEADHDTAKSDIAKIEKLFKVHGVVKPSL
jgi:DedD protein